MTMQWLFGEERNVESLGAHWTLQPRMFDIDVVPALYRLLDARATQELAEFDATNVLAPLSDELNQQREALVQRRPQITLHAWAAGMATQPEVIPVEDVTGLNAYDRSRIRLTGAGITITLSRREQSNVSSDQNADPRTVEQVVQVMRSEGRRRPQRGSILAIGILLIAAVLITLGIWAAVDLELLSVRLLIIALMLGVVVAAASAAVYVARKSRTTSPYEGRRWMRYTGNAFREGSLSDVRARIANTRATTVVSLIAGPIGAVIGAVVGWFLKEWLG